MKSFKDFVLLNEEASEELIKTLEELKYNEEGEYDWPDGLSDKGIDALESASSAEEFNTRKKEIIESLRSNKEGDSSSEETKAEKSIEDDIEGLKEYYDKNIGAGNIDNIFKYLGEIRKGNTVEQFFENTISSLNASIKEGSQGAATARKAKNTLIFYILFKALELKISKIEGTPSIFGAKLAPKSKDLKNAIKYMENDNIKVFLDTAFDVCEKTRKFLGLNKNGGSNGQFNKLIEKYSNTDIDDEGLFKLEKEIDNYKHIFPKTEPANEPARNGEEAKEIKNEPKTEPANEPKNEPKTEPANEPKNEPASETKNEPKNEPKNDGEEAKEIKLTGINAMNKNTSKEEFFKIHQEIYGDEKGNDLGSYYKQYEKQARDYQDKNDKLYHSSDFDKKGTKEELNNLKESSNVVMDIINNDAYKNIISENIFRGRKNISKERTETGRFGWGECLKDFKQIRSKAFTKAQGLFNSIFKENTGVNEKINLIQKYKEVAFKYRRDLEKTLYKFLEHNSYNEFGKMWHDSRISARKGFEKAKEALANSKDGKMLEVVRKEIASHLENLTPEGFEKAFNDTYKPIVGHYFANYNNSAIKDEDPIVNKTIEDAAFDAILNAKDLFGVSNKSEMILLAKAIFDKNDNQIIKLIKDWEDNYKNKELINPIRDDLEAVNKSGGIHGLTPLNIKYLVDIILPGETTITESIGSFRAFYEKEMLLETPQNNKGQFNPKKEARSFALYCLLSGMVGQKFKNACATYLQKLDRTPFSNEQYLAAANAYRKEHSGDADFSKKISMFDAILSVYNNGKGIQGEEDAGGATGNNSAAGKNFDQNQRHHDINNLSDQEEDSETGARAYDAPDQDTGIAPARHLDLRAIRNDPNYSQTPGAVNRSVVTEPQATVTTGAVGSYTIPDRLSKQLIRRKMKSRIDSAF